MHRMRIGIVIRLLALAVIPMLARGTGLANDTESQHAEMEPLEIIQDCIAAVGAGDFGRYVDHLSADELKLQAGYALLVNSIWSQSGDQEGFGSDPETLLLYRALSDLVGRHSLPECQWGPDQQAASKACQRMLNQVIGATVSATSYGYPQPAPTSGPAIRTTFIRSTDILDDPRQFLTDVLGEISRPTIVSGEGSRESAVSNSLGELAAGYAGLKWTLYTRGDYAVAVAVTSSTDDRRPAASGPAWFDGCTAAEVPQTQVEFRRMDGRWKIVRLLPLTVVGSSQASHSQPPNCTPSPSPVAPASVPAVPAEPIAPATSPYLR